MRSLSVPLFQPNGRKGIEAQASVGRFLIQGETSGKVVFSDVPISFMMGVDPVTGIVMDKHHPLLGTSLKDKVVALPKGRGSCASSAVILELLYLGVAPAALIFREMEEILLLGVLLADAIISKSIPVVLIQDDQTWTKISQSAFLTINNDGLTIMETHFRLDVPYSIGVTTTDEDNKLLRGENCSRATQIAMELIVEFASIQGAQELLDVSQVHIDACCLVGKTSLLVPQRLLELGGRVVVPATCNSLNVDRQRWQALGSDPETSIFASKIGDAYLAMGASMSFTCAPYLLQSKPKAGEQIGWGESNAVVFANSVLGARTQKYPDYLDVMIALTGRAPAMGCHLDAGRQPQVSLTVPRHIVKDADGSIFPLLGYHIGSLVGGSIPIIFGLEESSPGVPDLKAFGAGFATTSSAPMFHIMGVTPEASTVTQTQSSHFDISVDDLRRTWRQLNTALDDTVNVISLGNPHFALEEFPLLIKLIRGKTRKSDIEVIITMSRYVHDQAKQLGYLDQVQGFGVKVITDTCWCMLEDPVIPRQARQIMTNSAKYAHYGPGVSKRQVHFGSMAGCVEAACTGRRAAEDSSPWWLFGEKNHL